MPLKRRSSSRFCPSLSRVIPVITLILSCLVHKCTCWNDKGHQAIAMVTASALGSNIAPILKRLMGPHDVVDIANWAHEIEKDYSATAPLHFLFHPGPQSQCNHVEINDVNCPQGQCIVRALQFFYNKLKGQPKPAVPATTRELIPGIQFTDSDAVKFIVNLIGDLHQPLHVGFADDRGGQNISVSHWKTNRVREQTTLYQYWDSDYIQKVSSQRPDFWFGGWTHVNTLPSGKFAALEKEWNDEPEATRSNLFEKWASESLSKACSSAYKDIHDDSPIVSGHEISTAYDSQIFAVFKEQLLTAGARTAIVLNYLLADRDLLKLRQGSGLVLKAAAVQRVDKAPETKPSISKHLRAFSINMVIIVVVLGLLAYIAKYYSPGGLATTVSPMAKGKGPAAKEIEKSS